MQPLGILFVALVVCACQPPPASGSNYQPVPIAIYDSKLLEAHTAVDGFCYVGIDLPRHHRGDDLDSFISLGREIYACLTRSTREGLPRDAWFTETLFIRVDGDCPVRPEFIHFGCWHSPYIDLEIEHIGPHEICPHRTPMGQWSVLCWEQFYRVLGHEAAHAIYGSFH